MGNVVPLSLLHTGESGEVIDISGNDRLVARLAESGLRTGSVLEMLSDGNPLLLRVNDTKLSLRCDGQVEVMVALPQV